MPKDEKTDGRAASSPANGAKGGRPPMGWRPVVVNIKKEWIAEALKNGDLGEALEKAIKVALPKYEVMVQTRERLDKAAVAYDMHSDTVNLILLNNFPIKFEWELRYFVKEFVGLTKGKRDFSFTLHVPFAADKVDAES